jgi:ABC-type transporter Mla subunit MlaD
MAETITPSSRMARRAETDQAQFLKRWLAVWVALLTVVVAVVVVFLLFITSSLSSIDSNLVTANSDVGGAGGNVRNLPTQVERINGSLSTIDPALRPIPGQVDAIIGALSSIDGKLRTTDASLRTTSGTLQGSILGGLNTIRGLLIDADDPPDGRGVQNIHQRVAFLNGVGATGRFGSNPDSLTVAEADARNILAGLVDTNRALNGICESGAVQAAGNPPC